MRFYLLACVFLISCSLSCSSPVNETIVPHIVGGVEANFNEFPWLINLNLNGGMCGGTLIDWDLVLTSAHCVVLGSSCKTRPPNTVTATVTNHELNKTDSRQQTLTAVGIKVHENYNPDNFVNDIALIKLSRPFTQNSYVRLAPVASPDPASNGTVAGWGTTKYQGQISNILRKVTVPIVKGKTCTDQMTNPSGQFCAGEGGKDSCQGDSGGPFMCNTAPRSVCGIVSYGRGCAEAGFPGVYTNAYSYNSWIEKNKKNFVAGSCNSSVSNTVVE